MQTIQKSICSISIFLLFVSVNCLQAEETKTLETIAVLKEAYCGEMQAQVKYTAFASKAIEEGYPNIAYLFSSLSYSEAIHAKNFKNILSELKADIPNIEGVEIKCLSTKESLRNAVRVELAEIDDSYPRSLERIAPEGYSRAAQSLAYAWEAEKQHRDLLQKVNSNIGMFFGTIAKKIEKIPLFTMSAVYAVQQLLKFQHIPAQSARTLLQSINW